MYTNHMNYRGIIIQESLTNADLLSDLTIINSTVEPVTEQHKTPWLKQWTLHEVTVPAAAMPQLAERISKTLDHNYWYADFKNNATHYIIFPNKIFVIDRTKPEQYAAATAYGLTLNIPDYQLDFSPNIQ